MSSENKPTIGLSWAPTIPPLTFSKPKDNGSVALPQNPVWEPEAGLVDGLFVPPRDPRKLNKLLRKSRKDTAGTSWFDLPAPTITPEIKKDLEIIKLRGVIDPKRHYKKAGSKSKELPEYFQMGTVVESSSDFFSSRLTKKERKATIAEEILSDPKLKAYRKRKIREIETANHPGGKEKWKIKGSEMKKRGKQRRAIL